MDRGLKLIDDLIEQYPDELALIQLRDVVAAPDLDDLESAIEKIASTPAGKVKLIKRGKGLIRKIMGK